MQPATIRPMGWPMMGPMLGLALGLCVVLPADRAEAHELTINQGYVDLLSQAYGFCAGQSISAERIMREYPGLEWRAKRALLLFEAGTGDACGDAEEILREAMVPRFGEMRAGMLARIRPLIEEEPLSNLLATLFIAEIERRAEWEIDPPVRDTLLSVRYRGAPAAEMQDGHVQTFSTRAHPKALGVDATMMLPLSWKGEEGNRPHIVRKWRSQAGFGMSGIMLDIRDSEGWTATMEEVEAFASMQDPLEMAADGYIFRRASAFSHDTLPAITYEYDMPGERAGVPLLMRTVMHQVFLPDRVVGLMCQTGGMPDELDAIAAEFEAMAPLCRTVLNSLVLLDAYR